ncbi:formyltransferase family protein [Qipengyuania sp. XHP0207]|uniref:methionyl-tRNA formyltransferase n=1 Tax=Qipengyuania sp. XHP0207 TaxID=3038078 RepID=UPI00241E6F03|nr:formyltransferase family protein [Qipengyuania sp. XHP0207]MDG5747728.1 formyltransferase family protein [Qipengyuania sp. XHP0207]
MRIVLVGAVESTRVALKAMRESACDVAMVVTLDPALSGRHSDFVDLAPEARAAGADLLAIRKTNDPETLKAIADAAPDCIFVIGWSQICGPDFLAIAPGKTFGYHPAPLPRMRGRAVIPWTILADEKISGSSLFWMDEGVDTGALLAQEFFHVSPRETAASLYDKHMVALDTIVRRAIATLADGSAREIAQDEDCATYCARRRPGDGEIDWARSADEIDRLVRATGRPYPGAFTHSGETQLTVWSSSLPQDCRHHASPGQIVGIDGDALVVQTGSGTIRIEEWSMAEDKRPQMHAMLGRAS